MGHAQPIAQVCTDNTTAAVIANETINHQRSHAMNMRYFWICDQNIFRKTLIAWESGQENFADYFTKHHKRVRPIYLHTDKKTMNSPACIT